MIEKVHTSKRYGMQFFAAARRARGGASEVTPSMGGWKPPEGLRVVPIGGSGSVFGGWSPTSFSMLFLIAWIHWFISASVSECMKKTRREVPTLNIYFLFLSLSVLSSLTNESASSSIIPVASTSCNHISNIK